MRVTASCWADSTSSPLKPWLREVAMVTSIGSHSWGR